MTTDTRIESLETQVRTLKRMLFGVFGLVVVGGLLAAASMQSVPDVIQAKSFLVVNGEGKGVAVIGSDTEGGVLNIFNKDGEASISLLADQGGGVLGVFKDGNIAALIKGDSDGGFLRINNKGGKQVAALYADPVGGQLVISNKDGQDAALFSSADEGGMAVFYNYNNPTTENGVAGIGATVDGGLFGISNKEGKVVAKIKATPVGTVMIKTYDHGLLQVYDHKGQVNTNESASISEAP